MLHSTNGLQHLSKTLPRSQPPKAPKGSVGRINRRAYVPSPTPKPQFPAPQNPKGVENNPMGVSDPPPLGANDPLWTQVRKWSMGVSDPNPMGVDLPSFIVTIPNHSINGSVDGGEGWWFLSISYYHEADPGCFNRFFCEATRLSSPTTSRLSQHEIPRVWPRQWIPSSSRLLWQRMTRPWTVLWRILIWWPPKQTLRQWMKHWPGWLLQPTRTWADNLWDFKIQPGWLATFIGVRWIETQFPSSILNRLMQKDAKRDSPATWTCWRPFFQTTP